MDTDFGIKVSIKASNTYVTGEGDWASDLLKWLVTGHQGSRQGNSEHNGN